MKIHQKVLDHIKQLRIDLISSSSEVEENIQRDKYSIIKREGQLKAIQEELQSLDEVIRTLNIPTINPLIVIKKD